MNTIDFFITSSAHPVPTFLSNQPHHLDRSAAKHNNKKTSNNYATSSNKAKSAKLKKSAARKEQIVPDENSIEESDQPASMSCFVMDGQMYA
jgi:hypothetical protein